MSSRFARRLATAAIAGTMAWVALWSWGGLVEQPGHFLSPALLGAVLVVGVGSIGRTLGWPWYAVLPSQLAVLVLWLDHRYAAAAAWGGWVPTPGSIHDVADRIHAGAVAVNTFASPVSAEHPETYAYLLATSLLVLLSTDLLACGLRRVPWAGLPVIVTLTVPISVLEASLSWVVFVITSLLFIMLLATEETERVLGWGRSVAGRGERIDSLDQVVNGSTVRGSAMRIGLLTAAGALVLPILVPVTGGLLKGNGDGGGNGSGNDSNVTLRNPIVDLRRDLISQNHIPLVEAQTTGDPGYLRLTVLDKFSGVEWLPSARQLAKSNNANGKLPTAPGMQINAAGTDANWSIRLLDGFQSTWLPTPYPTRSIDIKKGDWRYDLRTLDVASVDKQDTAGLSYNLVGFTPELSPTRMQAALTAPSAVRAPMTSVPGNRPSVITRIAQEVTAGATTDYDRMVALQTWFRNTGGFSYSLEPAPGSGISQLVRFITTDKVGYCEQFAAAMAVMARSLGVPARVAVGFLAPQRLQDGTYLYTSDDLHAWPEIYFSGTGWVRFEPTPAARTGTTPPSWTVGTGAPTTRPTGPSATAAPSQAPTKAPRELDKTASAKGSSEARATAVGWAVGVLLLALVLALPRWVRSRQRRRRLGDHRLGPVSDDARVLADGAWAELVATARDLGIALPLQRSVREISGALRRRTHGTTDAVRRLEELTLFVERALYARPFAVDPATRQAVVEAVEKWSDLMDASVATSRSRVARVFPRSVFDRRTASLVVDRQVELAGAGAPSGQ
ncbi:transglutaminase-like putative cysteine protease [Marmoricola sp. URHA0025 HA25]